MLEGDLTVEGQLLQPGDYCAASPDTVHHITSTRAGCMFLLTPQSGKALADDAAPVAHQPGLILVRASEGVWRSGPDAGVTQRTLRVNQAPGTWTGLGRMEPGARLPRHYHRTAEQFYMLEGDAHVTGQVLHPGDYYRAPAGTSHDVTHTDAGCLFLLISSDVEIGA